MSATAAQHPAQRYPADPSVAGSVRAFIVQRLLVLHLGELAEDAELLTSELVTNAILHAQTEFEVAVAPIPAGVDTATGVRVEVRDGAVTMPNAGTLTNTAGSGRGLMLVAALATRWGAQRLPGTGKAVWFELVTGEENQVPDLEAMQALWSDGLNDNGLDNDDQGERPVEVVIPDIAVAPLLVAKAHMEDLIRELQLSLIGYESGAATTLTTPPVVHLARRLDAAAQEFADGRRQIRVQALTAAARGDTILTLRLHLPPSALGAVTRYRQAIVEAEQLGDAGGLLTPGLDMHRHTVIRHTYLTQIIAQLDPASRHRRIGD